jgi:hypothetical protein
LLKSLAILQLIILSFGAFAQIDKEGLPMTWSNTETTTTVNIWKDLPSIDLLALQAQDELDQTNKAIPFRFAYATDVNFNTVNSGRWTNLDNGDRVWVLGMKSEIALSLNITFSEFMIPDGGKVYIYNNSRTDFIGPLTYRNNSDGTSLTTLPVSGNEIVIEYYEPYAFRGDGVLEISSVSQAYKSLESASNAATSCIYSLPENQNDKTLSDISSSVLLMLVDNGQRVATGTLVNNTQNDGTPYFVTSSASLMGDPNSWVFVFGLNNENCSSNSSSQSDVACWDKALTGAVILAQDAPSGMALLQISNRPKTSWGVYYAGWSGQPTSTDHFACIQQAFGINQSMALYSGVLQASDWNGLQAAEIGAWSQGNTFVGSVGSPMFNDSGLFCGVLVGGNSSCDTDGSDYVALLSSAWNSFKPFLNSTGSGKNNAEGFYPIFIDEQTNEASSNPFFVFPNPAKDFIYIQNESESAVLKVEFIDSSGRLTEIERPSLPMIDLIDLPAGIYQLRIITTTGTETSRVVKL